MKPLVALAAFALLAAFPPQSRAGPGAEPALAQALTNEQCAALAQLAVPASAIALPTGGARVTGAHPFAASPLAAAHCLVDGEIAPVDPKAPPIRFKVALPLAWNGKALAFGGGGFNGTVPPVSLSIFSLPTPPLARGYATFAGDSGHKENPAAPGDFMTNAEALRNYMGDSIKKTHDAAVAVIRAAYGRVPDRTYFVGGSTGGREALWAAGRWPDDWNAVISFFPARGITTMLGTLRIDQHFAAPGAFIPPAKRALLLAAANEACDALDGLKDGLIVNRLACEARFVPARASYQGKPLRCPGGGDTGEDCLSDAQLKALAVMQEPVRFGYPLAWSNVFPGYTAYTSDLGIRTKTPVDQALLFFGLGLVPPGYPLRVGMSHHFGYDDNFLRFGVVGDPATFNPMTFDPEHPGPYAKRLYELSKADTGDLDLSRFAARGGKVVIVHGTADMIVSVRMTERYVAQLRRKMGAARVDSFLRFYEIPGYSHGVSNTFSPSWDFLTALEDWSERGIDPGETQVMTDTVVPGRALPLCRYPRWARYKGTGDPKAAASFVCTAK